MPAKVLSALDDLPARRQHPVRLGGFGAGRVHVAHPRAGRDLLNLAGVEDVLDLRLGLVDLVLRAAHVAHHAVTVVLPVHEARLRLDGADRALLVVQVGRHPVIQHPAGVVDAAPPLLALAVVDLHHHQPAFLLVDPRDGCAAVSRPVVERLLDGPGVAAVGDGGGDGVLCVRIERGHVVAVHPLGAAHVAGVAEVLPARPRVVEELLPADRLDRHLVVVVRLDDGRAGPLNEVGLRPVQLHGVEVVLVGHEPQRLGRHVGAVLVLRVARIGAWVGLALLEHAQRTVHGRADAIEHQVGLLARLQRRSLGRRPLVAVVVVVVDPRLDAGIVGQGRRLLEHFLEGGEVGGFRHSAHRDLDRHAHGVGHVVAGALKQLPLVGQKVQRRA